MKPYPLISIISVNYKQSATTNLMIHSLQAISYPNIEIIIVDNASEKVEADKLDLSAKNVRLIKSDKNLGFAGGNNLGLKYSKGDYILFLNNDTEVAPDFLEQMLLIFQQHENVGAVSPKIKFFDKPDLIQYAGFTKMNPFTLRMNALGNKQPDNGRFDRTQETDSAHGCAMLVPRKIIDTVGPMPEDYFLYYEEHDWSQKILNAGYKIFYRAESVVYHKESVSVKKNSTLKTYFLNRNRILYMKRNFSLFQKIVAIVYLSFVSVPKNIASYILKNESDHLKAYIDALLWNINRKTKAKWNL